MSSALWWHGESIEFIVLVHATAASPLLWASHKADEGQRPGVCVSALPLELSAE